jgi:hypothetical protein
VVLLCNDMAGLVMGKEDTSSWVPVAARVYDDDARLEESQPAPLTVIVNWKATRRHLMNSQARGAWSKEASTIRRRMNSC